MNKLNKKGFTLIELLAVLVILSIIMTIALPNVTSSLERNKEKQKQAKIKLIESSAEVYADSHKNSVGAVITIDDLICSGILNREQIIDPTRDNYTICGTISSTDYKFSESQGVSSICDMNNSINCE